MTVDALVPLCTALQDSVTGATDALRDFVVDYPSARQDLAVLSRELAELQLVSRLLGRNGDEFDRGSKIVPEKFLRALRGVISKAGVLVEEVNDALYEGDSGDGRRQAWLEHTAERLAPMGRLAENSRIAMNLGLDVLLFVTNLQPSDGADLPAYSTSQISQEISVLKSRLEQDSDTDDHRVQAQHLPLIGFVEALQEYMEQTSRRLSVPQTEVSTSSTTVSSLHSETQPPIPDYNAIGITNPAPLSISIRHIAKKNYSNLEIVQVCFLTRNNKTTIAVSTMDPPTRFFDTNINPVSSLTNQGGVNMTFSPDGRSWVYLCEDDMRDMGAWYHDGVHFKKPCVVLGDYINGRKIQQMKWPGVRPFGFSPDGRWLAVGSARGRIALIDVKSGGILAKATIIPCHLDEITHAVFTPDSKYLVSQSRDGTIRLTDPQSRTSIAKLETDTWKKPLFLGVLPNNEVIVSVWGDTVFHWNYHTASLETYNLSGRRNREGWPIAISQDCRFLCCRTDDGVDISDLHSGKILYTIKFQSGYVTTAAFSQDGKYLVLGKAASWMGVRVTTSTLDVWELIF